MTALSAAEFAALDSGGLAARLDAAEAPVVVPDDSRAAVVDLLRGLQEHARRVGEMLASTGVCGGDDPSWQDFAP